MIKLQTNYLGLNLKNPIIVSSSGLTDNVEKIKKLEDKGAAAVVLKSLFEEQINFEAFAMLTQTDYPEADDYIRNYTKSHSLDQYLNLIREAKKAVKIPVIASINCLSANNWVSFATKIEDAGADALELNIYFFPSEKEHEAKDYEMVYHNLAVKVREKVSIPIAMKLGHQFTNLVNLVDKLYYRGIQGVVLFNRFYEPDIDIDALRIKSSEVFSTPADINKTLRWVGIISHLVDQVHVGASTGVHDASAAIKLLLAGANAVQVCSLIYKEGPDAIVDLLNGIEEWMKKNNFNTIKDFQGILNYGRLPDPATYERFQFMKYFSGIH